MKTYFMKKIKSKDTSKSFSFYVKVRLRKFIVMERSYSVLVLDGVELIFVHSSWYGAGLDLCCKQGG